MDEELTFELIAEAYFELGDKIAVMKKRHEAELAPLEKEYEEVKSLGHALLLRSGADAVKVKGVGRAFFKDKTNYSIESMTEFFKWLKTGGDASFIRATVIQKSADEYAAEHDGSPPPGTKKVTEQLFYIQRSK